MAKFILDYESAEVRILSNDAFMFLMYDEEPVDADNLEEVDELKALYPNGFTIDDNWSYLEDGEIEVKLIPYIKDESNIAWDGENRCYNSRERDRHPWLFKITSDNTVYIKWHDEITGEIIYEGECELYYTGRRPWAKTPKGTHLPLFGKRQLNYSK